MKTEIHGAKPSTRSRRLPALILLAVVIAVAGAVGWTLYSKNNSAQAETRAKADDKKNVVYELAGADVAIIKATEMTVNLPISGSLVPVNQATVKSKVTAEVRQTFFQEGMPVKKGQILAQFDAADLHAKLLTQDAAVDEAKAKLELAQKNRTNNEALLKQNYISQNAFDVTHNSLELAEANLKSALSLREVAQIAVADTEIKAPVDGIISKRFVQTGDKVSPDAPLFSIVNLAQLTLEAAVPASEIPRIKIGQLVDFSVDGFAGRHFAGKVARINPAAEAGSRSMLVYIAVDNADAALRGGMFAKGNLIVEKTTAFPVMPLSALRRAHDTDVVYTVVNNQVREQAVKLGLRNEDEGLVQVLEGLTPGANVLAVKLDEIKPGAKVRMTKPVATTGKG